MSTIGEINPTSKGIKVHVLLCSTPSAFPMIPVFLCFILVCNYKALWLQKTRLLRVKLPLPLVFQAAYIALVTCILQHPQQGNEWTISVIFFSIFSILVFIKLSHTGTVLQCNEGYEKKSLVITGEINGKKLICQFFFKRNESSKILQFCLFI